MSRAALCSDDIFYSPTSRFTSTIYFKLISPFHVPSVKPSFSTKC